MQYIESLVQGEREIPVLSLERVSFPSGVPHVGWEGGCSVYFTIRSGMACSDKTHLTSRTK